MEDGFYLSTYIHIGEMEHLLNFHIRHDQNISLLEKKGEVIRLKHMWELERETGLKKHSLSFYSTKQAEDFINQLLSKFDLTLADMVQVIGTPQLDTCSDYHSCEEFSTIAYHSIAHLFTGLLFDTDIFYKENILALAVDGGPDSVVDKDIRKKAFYAGGLSSKGNVRVEPVCSPGFLWTFARKITKLEEGSLMALASASDSVFLEDYQELVEIYGSSDLEKAQLYVKELYGRINQLTVADQGKKFTKFDQRFSEKENKISMFAKKIQELSLKIMDRNVQQVVKLSEVQPSDMYLSITGGYGLNCPTNSYLMNKYQFKGFLAPPCVNDAGLSLGIGLYYFYKKMTKLQFKLASSYFGNDAGSFSENQLKQYEVFVENISAIDSEEFIEDINEAPVVWFDGRAEIGPRALGHRSLLGSATSAKIKDQLNEIKKRQWWRPVAPIVLDEFAGEWFETNYYSPFMLHTMKIKKDRVHLVPAISHLDDSARVQTIREADNPSLYKIIHALYEKTGVPIICNTSLNDNGEPIVNSIEECINFILRKRIKIAYINGQRFHFKNHELYQETKPLKRRSIDIFSEEEKKKQLEEKNPFKLSKEELIFMHLNPTFGKQIDLRKREDTQKLARFSSIAKKKLGDIPIPGI